MSGTVIYRGPSTLDGAPIVAVLTYASGNRKTGAMDQTWILRADLGPIDAARSGADASICGGCPLRATVPGMLRGRACYVNLAHGPRGVWDAWRRGRYGRALDFQLPAVGEGRTIRLGAYGDPAAVPFDVWRALLARAKAWTGYTHQWQTEVFDARLLRYVMASAEDSTLASVPPDARAFHVRPKGAPLPKGMVQCPAAAESKAGRVTCSDCLLCGGTSRGGTRSVSIEAHGSGARMVATL